MQKFCKKTEVARIAHTAENTEEKEEQLFMATIEQACNTTEIKTSLWLIDSGCTNDMTADLELFTELDRKYLSKVRIANGDYVQVEGKGAIVVDTMAGTKILRNEMYVP